MARDTYSAEPCSTCGAAIVGALLDDHGFVIEAACATHRHYLARSFVAGAFVIEVEVGAVRDAA